LLQPAKHATPPMPTANLPTDAVYRLESPMAIHRKHYTRPCKWTACRRVILRLAISSESM
jgi:hypothetical protein